jgi:hypothetical protein
MTDNPSPPSILSGEFHAKFFPQLLSSRLRLKKRNDEGTSFSHNMDFTIMFAVCLVLAAIGLPSALARGSLVGWILSIMGILGILAFFTFSVLSQLDTRPTYDRFLVGIFFFFVFLGITAGIFVGTLNHSLFLGILCSAVGLLIGYVVGIFAGLWFQYLGWLAALVNMLAGLGIIGMITVDLVLLFG